MDNRNILQKLAAAAFASGSNAKTPRGQLRALGGAACAWRRIKIGERDRAVHDMKETLEKLSRSIRYCPVSDTHEALSSLGKGASLSEIANLCGEIAKADHTEAIAAFCRRLRALPNPVVAMEGVMCYRLPREVVAASPRPRITDHTAECSLSGPTWKVIPPVTNWYRGQPSSVNGAVVAQCQLLVQVMRSADSMLLYLKTPYGPTEGGYSRCKLPAGWSASADELGLVLRHAKCSDYHPTPEDLNSDEELATACAQAIRDSLERTRIAEAESERLQEIEKNRHLTVRLADSRRAGNCVQGTERWVRLVFGAGREWATIGEILSVADRVPAYKGRALNAVAARLGRAKTQRQRLGLALT